MLILRRWGGQDRFMRWVLHVLYVSSRLGEGGGRA